MRRVGRSKLFSAEHAKGGNGDKHDLSFILRDSQPALDAVHAPPSASLIPVSPPLPAGSQQSRPVGSDTDLPIALSGVVFSGPAPKSGEAGGLVIGGKYRYLEILGQGGMGTVFLAEAPDRTRAAVKILVLEQIPAGSRDGAVARFLQEANLAIHVNHPNVAKIFDFGFDPSSKWFYIAMEYIKGKDLDKYLKSEIGTGRIALKDFFQIALQFCDGVRAFHEKGIVHRDVKLENAMVLDDRSGHLVVRIIDPGIAKQKFFGRTPLPGTGITQQPFSAIGTPEYMAPEAYCGDTSFRSDVYSIGISLYRLLCNKFPFFAPDYDKLMRKHMNETPISPHDFDPNIPEELSAIIMKCLAKAPNDRYPIVYELIVELMMCAERLGVPVDFTPYSPEDSDRLRVSEPMLDVAGFGGIPESDASSLVVGAVAIHPPARSFKHWMAAGAVALTLGAIAYVFPSIVYQSMVPVTQIPPTPIVSEEAKKPMHSIFIASEPAGASVSVIEENSMGNHWFRVVGETPIARNQFTEGTALLVEREGYFPRILIVDRDRDFNVILPPLRAAAPGSE
ncbi:MAG: serine/threonine-protein kinase [Candidatus Micrarchaeota archaeon]